MKFRIFAGLGGGFGGAQEVGISLYDSELDALDEAFEIAVDTYYSYAGYHGLFNREEALEKDPSLSEEDLDEMENEDIENWIEYWVEEVIDEEDDAEIEDDEDMED